MKKIIFVSVLMVFMAVPFAQAKISLGSVQDIKFAETMHGESVEFRLLFFNIHERETLHLELDVKHPEGWNASLNPASMELEYTEPGFQEKESGYEYLSTSSGIIKVNPVYVTVKVPELAEEGGYTIRVSAKTGKEGGVLSTYQIRNFYFKIYVKSGDESIVSDIGEEAKVEPEKGEGDMDDKKESEERDNIPEDETEPEDKEQGSEEKDFKDFLGEATGMLTSNPGIPVLTLAAVIVLAVFLRLTKKI